MRHKLQRAANVVGAGRFAARVLVFMVQVVARFGFNRPLPWTDEVAVMLYVWVILWAAAFIVPEREHVMFDLVWNAVGPRTRKVMRLAGHTMIGGLAAWALPASWDSVYFMRREGTPVLGLPFVFLLAALVVRSAVGVWRAWRGLDLEDAGVPVS